MEVREYGDIPPIFENPGLPDQPILLLAQAIEEQEEEESESIATICLAAILTLIILMTIGYCLLAILAIGNTDYWLLAILTIGYWLLAILMALIIAFEEEESEFISTICLAICLRTLG